MKGEVTTPKALLDDINNVDNEQYPANNIIIKAKNIVTKQRILDTPSPIIIKICFDF